MSGKYYTVVDKFEYKFSDIDIDTDRYRRFYARLAQLKIETFQMPLFKIQLKINGNINTIILHFLIYIVISYVSENWEW